MPDRLAAAAFGAAALAVSALTAPAFAAPCYDVAGDRQTYRLIDGYDFTAEAARPGLVARPPLAEDSAGLLCVRDSVVPRPNDFEMLYHAPLFLAEQSEDGLVVAALGHGDGTYLYRVLRGEIDETTRERAIEALEGFDAAERALRATPEG
ncbi:MAG: hypothetical protein ACOC0V_00185 [Oceanicaulis sp.]